MAIVIRSCDFGHNRSQKPASEAPRIGVKREVSASAMRGFLLRKGLAESSNSDERSLMKNRCNSRWNSSIREKEAEILRAELFAEATGSLDLSCISTGHVKS